MPYTNFTPITNLTNPGSSDPRFTNYRMSPGSSNSDPGIGGGGMGAIIGALLGGSNAGGRPAGTTTTTQDLPAWQLPYFQGAMPGAARTMEDTIAGKYLDPASNPYLDLTYKHAAGLLGSGIDSRFSAAGRYGSGAHQGVLQEGFGNLATGLISYAEGFQTRASGRWSNSEGFQTVASGDASHAECGETLASGTASHAENWRTHTGSTRVPCWPRSRSRTGA